MFSLRDFYHLPQMEALVGQILATGQGLVLVAGLDNRPRTSGDPSQGFLPSGRATTFRLLIDEFMTAQPSASAIVVSEDKDAVRIPRQFRKRMQLSLVGQSDSFSESITLAARHRPGLLVVDRLDGSTASPALAAANGGLRVIAQLDTVFRGAAVARHLLDLGVSPVQLEALAWTLAVHRLPRLCPHCKGPDVHAASKIDALLRRYARLEPLLAAETSFMQAEGCEHCQLSGRQGDVAVFDVFQATGDPASLFDTPSLLAMEAYALQLAGLGFLSLDDCLDFDSEQLRRTFNLFVESEQALKKTNVALQRKLLELQSANRVLQQRTEALISLENINQALISSTDLDHLADQVCRRSRDLCGADRAMLFYQRNPGEVEVLATLGWASGLLHKRLAAGSVFAPANGTEPVAYNGLPAGLPAGAPTEEPLLAGLYMPLFAQKERVGMMVVHSTQKARFMPGEVALLKTFANQAALAIQRAGLIEQLQLKIDQLEAAQIELVKKERMEREMELARQVQQSVLPHTFPQLAGHRFAALNEPARQVGGDFYDVIPLGPDHFGLAIADVSDKGMPAALYMALTRSLLRAEAQRELSPAAVVANLNRLLLELGEPNLYVTLFYGVVECKTRRLTYVRAGHDRPVLLRDGKTEELAGQGAPLCVFSPPQFSIEENAIPLASGDYLVLYTDGLSDILLPDGGLFDRQQLLDLLQAHVGLSAEELCETVFARLSAVRGNAEQYDDMTMLVLQEL